MGNNMSDESNDPRAIEEEVIYIQMDSTNDRVTVGSKAENNSDDCAANEAFNSGNVQLTNGSHKGNEPAAEDDSGQRTSEVVGNRETVEHEEHEDVTKEKPQAANGIEDLGSSDRIEGENGISNEDELSTNTQEHNPEMDDLCTDTLTELEEAIKQAENSQDPLTKSGPGGDGVDEIDTNNDLNECGSKNDLNGTSSKGEVVNRVELNVGELSGTSGKCDELNGISAKDDGSNGSDCNARSESEGKNVQVNVLQPSDTVSNRSSSSKISIKIKLTDNQRDETTPLENFGLRKLNRKRHWNEEDNTRMSAGAELGEVKMSVVPDQHREHKTTLNLEGVPETKRSTGVKFAVAVFLTEVLMVVLFAIFGEYGPDLDPKANKPDSEANLNRVYPMFQDVHVMIFIGFGFLMTFLKKYGYGAVSVNMLLAAITIQFAAFCNSMLHLTDGKFLVDINTLLLADFTAAAVLISFGVVLGRASPLQLLIMTLIECVVFAVNEYIGRLLMHAVDMGDSIFVHTFGAYFGLGVSIMLYRKNLARCEKAESRYNSDITSMIGTLFLWAFWPSFNAAGAANDERSRAIIHTYYSIAASCVTTFLVSAILDKRGRLSMEHIQNATLAGGVAVGASADFVLTPYAALIIGSVTGIISTLGFKALTPCMAKRLRLYDTCGVHNLHGIPGIIAIIVSAVAAATATTDLYGNSLYEVFPAMAPVKPSNASLVVPNTVYGEGYSASRMAIAQLAAAGITLGISIAAGMITGLIMRLPIFDEPRSTIEMYEDEAFFNVAEEQ